MIKFGKSCITRLLSFCHFYRSTIVSVSAFPINLYLFISQVVIVVKRKYNSLYVRVVS